LSVVFESFVTPNKGEISDENVVNVALNQIETDRWIENEISNCSTEQIQDSQNNLAVICESISSSPDSLPYFSIRI
jgi:hypothetical protein